uniref:Transmembrane protein 135 n=1 Tax=Cacopsylla melanoneura TaxID=428564 RepID=A0A8D8YHK3_9HEMI
MGGQIQSKFQTFPIRCSDYVHPWCQSCSAASAGLFMDSVQQSFRIYFTAYLLALLMKGRVPSKQDLRRTISGIIQSTFFLTCHAFGFSMTICTMRRLCGSFNVATVAFVPCLISSLGAILVERPSRRSLLSLYVTNIASETVFRMLTSRGYITPIPLGEVIIFATSMATLAYFYKTSTNKDDSIYSLLRFVVGKEEQYGYTDTDPLNGANNAVATKSSLLTFLYDKLNSQFSTSSVCPHPDSCVAYALQGGGKLFSVGLGLEFCLKLLLNMKRIIRRPTTVANVLMRPSTLRLGGFLGGFSTIFRAVSCTLRRHFGSDSKNFAIPAGLLASLAFCLYKDNTIALYVFWKTLQILYVLHSARGTLPTVPHASVLFHCVSTAILFHAAIFEPHNLRPSYWKFLHAVSGGRFAVMDRQHLGTYAPRALESLFWTYWSSSASHSPKKFGSILL